VMMVVVVLTVGMVMVSAPVMDTSPARRRVRLVEAPPLLPLGLALLFSMVMVLE